MEILNIGPLELLVILVLAVLLFGPDDLANFAHKAGRWIYNLRKSELWQEIIGTTKEIQEFPQKIMKEAELEETIKEIDALNASLLNSNPHPKTIDAAITDPPLGQAAEEYHESVPKDTLGS